MMARGAESMDGGSEPPDGTNPNWRATAPPESDASLTFQSTQGKQTSERH